MKVVGGLLTGLAPVNPGDAAAMCAQQDVFVDREVGNQTDFLRSDGDAVTLGIFRALKMYGAPSTKIWPSVGTKRPQMMFIRVDLPAPFSPMIE